MGPSAQGVGGIGSRARVLNAQPAQAGLRMAADVIRGWTGSPGASRRAEGDLTTVTMTMESSSAVVSIHFLRN